MENRAKREEIKPESRIKRVGGFLRRVVPKMDGAGKVLNYAFSPLMVEFRLRDLMQVIVGASILAIIQKYPFGSDNLMALKRILIVAFPASMSAALSDSLKESPMGLIQATWRSRTAVKTERKCG